MFEDRISSLFGQLELESRVGSFSLLLLCLLGARQQFGPVCFRPPPGIRSVPPAADYPLRPARLFARRRAWAPTKQR